MRNFYTALLTIAIIMSFGRSIFAAEVPSYITPYSVLLGRYVEEGNKDSIKTSLVDYKAWSKDRLHLKMMGHLQRVNPDDLAGVEKKAFWINAYNILTIDLIIRTQEQESIKNLGSIFSNPWKSHDWTINGRKYTLDEIEHQILRPMGDPRIHMAINCASLSCPDLADTPYIASTLDNQLDIQTKLFLDNDTKGMNNLTGTQVKLSMIFKWFAKDFGGESGSIKLANKYIASPLSSESTIEYFDYNWQLNSRN